MVVIEVPVKRYIKVYLERHYRHPKIKKHNSPVVELTRKTTIGDKLYDLVEKPRRRDELKYVTSQYNHTVYILLTKDLFLRRGHHLTNSNIISFNNTVEREINLKVRVEADTVRRLFPEKLIKEVLHDVLKSLCLNFEILPYETVKQAYFRYRKAQKLQKQFDYE